jgi:TolB protein
VNGKRNSSLNLVCALFLISVVSRLAGAQTTAATSPTTSKTGLFEDHADVGTVLHPGSLEYDPSRQTYVVSGSGENMWLGTDAFHFVWKKASGDVSLTADISFANSGGNAHKKAVLMVRQSLDADSVYADVALHGNGMTALQYRDEKGALTREVQSNLSAPARLRIVKQGDFVYLWLADAGGEFKVAGASVRLPLQGTFYVGIGVCSHDKDAIEKAAFSRVDLTTPPAPAGEPKLYSALETISISSADRRVVYVAPEHFEAPNWTRDGAAFLFNSDGRILRLPVAGGTPATLDTGFAIRCNNDHGISPDSKWLAISDQSQEDHHSLIYLVPIEGGTPRRITKNSPSYWHAWSPDGTTQPSLDKGTETSISTPFRSQVAMKPA